MAPRSRATGRTPAARRRAAQAGARADGSARAGAPRPANPTPRQREALRAVVATVVAGVGYDLEELTVSRAGRRYLVRAIVDADGGVSLDAIADVSRAVSAALDQAEAAGGELVAGEYQLEVSSPGVDRPLTQPRHWRRNRGRLVKVSAGGRQLTARVLDADETGVLLDIDSGRHIAYPELGPGRVQVEFHRPDESAGEDGPTGDLDEIGAVDDDGDEGDFGNAFDGDGFTGDDGVDGRSGNQSWSSGVDLRPGSIEDQGREEER
jgi:ribosome maturation factor RimP